jgi:hypothetical protein
VPAQTIFQRGIMYPHKRFTMNSCIIRDRSAWWAGRPDINVKLVPSDFKHRTLLLLDINIWKICLQYFSSISIGECNCGSGMPGYRSLDLPQAIESASALDAQIVSNALHCTTVLTLHRFHGLNLNRIQELIIYKQSLFIWQPAIYNLCSSRCFKAYSSPWKYPVS